MTGALIMQILRKDAGDRIGVRLAPRLVTPAQQPTPQRQQSAG
jgi:hypothetical protein